MFSCKECGAEFKEAKEITETHGLLCPPFEKKTVCPFCSSSAIKEIIYSHCRCCGAKLKDNVTGYCSETCKEKGEKLRAKELKRKKQRYNSPINEILRKKDEFNKQNGTMYSYGQFVALILPKLKAEKSKCKKRKNI